MHHVSIMIYLRYWNYIFTQDRTNNNITKKQSHTFCFLSFWWPVVLMGGTLGWGWARAAEEEEQLKLLAEFHLDPVAWKKRKTRWYTLIMWPLIQNKLWASSWPLIHGEAVIFGHGGAAGLGAHGARADWLFAGGASVSGPLLQVSLYLLLER